MTTINTYINVFINDNGNLVKFENRNEVIDMVLDQHMAKKDVSVQCLYRVFNGMKEVFTIDYRITDVYSWDSPLVLIAKRFAR